MLDTGNNLVLSVETDRIINLNSSRYFLGVEGDKEVKIIRFQLDRYYCGIDLSVFKPRVNYKLSNSKEYYGEATMADFDEDYIYVEWTLDPSVTSVKGRVDFLVQLTKLDEDGSILKRYNSTMAIGRVEEGLNPEDQLPESIKKDILAIAEDTLTQLKESKTEFDNRLKIISDKQNKIIVRLDATDLKINNFDEDYETKMNEFHTDYQEKMKSAIKNIEDTSVQSVTNVENAKDEALQSIQNKSTEFLNNIDEAENMAIKNIKNSGEYYQDQINELQKSEALQDEVLDKLNEEVDLKLTSPYLNNKGENHVVNSDNGALKNIIVKGNTVQNSTKGLNLINCTPKTTTINGITMVNNGDGTYTVNGTATDDFDIALAPYTTKQNIYYTLSGCPSGGSKTTYYLDPRGYEYDTDRGTTIINPNQDFSNYIRIVIKKDVTVNNLLFKPMFNEGQTAQPFEPYTGGAPSPSPEYPQEIKAVSKLSGAFYSKNLFDFNIIKDSNITKGTAVWTNNSVTITSNASDCYTESYSKKNYIKVKPNTTYTLLFKRDKSIQGSIYIFEKKDYDDSGYYDLSYNTSSDLKKAWTFTTKSSTNYLAFRLGIYSSGQTCTFSEIMLVEGSHTWDNISYENGKQSLLNYTLQNPLYKLGDIYDYIDVNKGKIVRNVGVVTFDGSSDEDIRLSPPDGSRRVYLYLFRNSILSIENINPYCKSNMFKFTNLWTDGVMSHNHLFYVSSTNIYVSYNEITSLNDFKTWLKQNPITVVYQLATPVEEPLPSDLQTLLQSLKSYYPQTNIMFDTEVEPYINFDYKLNLKSWIEDKDNKEIEYDKSVNDIQPYSDSYIEKWFNLMRTGRVYTVKFPLWETSQSPIGEKLDANRGLICEPSTPVYAGQNDYDEIPVFKTFDVNAYVDNDGEVHLTAFKGDENFQDTGKVDVFVLTMSYYEKTWTEDGYWYYSISDSPKPGYTIAKECLKKDGSIRPYALYAKYVAGAIDGQPYSSKGLIPCYYPFETISAYHMVSYCKQRGKYYTGGLMWDYKYIWTRFMLKFANTNSQAVLGGVFDYSMQYPITVAEENVKRVIISKSNATRYVVGSCVSIGDWDDATSMDRSNKKCHNIARNVKILTIENIDDSNSALNLDLAEPITTTTTCRVTTMHYLSGYSDEILGRDGSLGADPKSTKHPIVISGIECAVGGYEIPCNAMMNILNASGDREVYITHDATKLSTNTQTIMNTWKKSGMTIKTSKVNNWQYITKMGIDTELGCVLPLAAGESGSGSSTGFGDGLYCDNAATGQREFLLFGNLGNGSVGGLSYLLANYGFSYAGWLCLARISIMAVRGE